MRLDAALVKRGLAQTRSEASRMIDAGNVTVLQENPPQELLAKARQAEKYCPTKAITIELK